MLYLIGGIVILVIFFYLVGVSSDDEVSNTNHTHKDNQSASPRPTYIPPAIKQYWDSSEEVPIKAKPELSGLIE